MCVRHGCPALRELQHANVAPVDLAQAALAPGTAVFTHYTKVVEPTGETMAVRSALPLTSPEILGRIGPPGSVQPELAR